MVIFGMRPLYFKLKGSLRYALHLFYRRIRVLNKPTEFRTKHIFIGNHPGAFMDPLVISVIQNPIVYFLVRSDVFKKSLLPILNSAQMIPIYRALDGAGAVQKNDEVFDRCQDVLRSNRGLILFGEGFTDDTFVRRLKPMKKGAARIAIGYVEKNGWDDVKISAVGINYAHPNYFRGEVLISNSEILHLKDYKTIYDDNPKKAINQLTKDVGVLLQNQLTHVEDINLSPMHDDITSITGWGLHPVNADNSVDIEDRWKASRWLALEMNKKDSEAWEGLKNDLHAYRSKLQDLGFDEIHVRRAARGKSIIPDLLLNLLLTPLAILGVIHNIIPWAITKTAVEKMFKRTVFWGGVKMVVGKYITFLMSIPWIFVFHAYVYPSWLLAILYVWGVTPWLGVLAYSWVRRFNNMGKQLKAKSHLKELSAERETAVQGIKAAGLWNEAKKPA